MKEFGGQYGCQCLGLHCFGAGGERGLSWLAHGCSAGTDGVCANVISCLAHGCSAGTDGVCGKRYGIGERAEAENAESARIPVRTSRICRKTQDMKHMCKRGKTLGRRVKPRAGNQRSVTPTSKKIYIKIINPKPHIPTSRGTGRSDADGTSFGLPAGSPALGVPLAFL